MENDLSSTRYDFESSMRNQDADGPSESSFDMTSKTSESIVVRIPIMARDPSRFASAESGLNRDFLAPPFALKERFHML